MVGFLRSSHICSHDLVSFPCVYIAWGNHFQCRVTFNGNLFLATKRTMSIDYQNCMPLCVPFINFYLLTTYRPQTTRLDLNSSILDAGCSDTGCGCDGDKRDQEGHCHVAMVPSFQHYMEIGYSSDSTFWAKECCCSKFLMLLRVIVHYMRTTVKNI